VLTSADNDIDSNRMQSVLHIERVDSAPGTPASNPGQEFRSSPSRQRFSLDALMSPLKSFRSRRKFHISDNQSPKTVKHERSLFSLFNTARTQTPDSPEVFKVGTAVKRPKTVAPSKNNLRDSRSRYAVNLTICNTNFPR
jgi:hypothetical protein